MAARPQFDSAGGAIPQNVDRDRRADLITLPPDVEGTNCHNCMFVDMANLFEGNPHVAFCRHKEIRQYVTRKNCCIYWDNLATVRPPAYGHQFPVLTNSIQSGTGV
jgi:hypothetical protein